MVLLNSVVSVSVAQAQSIDPGSCSAIELLAEAMLLDGCIVILV